MRLTLETSLRKKGNESQLANFRDTWLYEEHISKALPRILLDAYQVRSEKCKVHELSSKLSSVMSLGGVYANGRIWPKGTWDLHIQDNNNNIIIEESSLNIMFIKKEKQSFNLWTLSSVNLDNLDSQTQISP